jgi:hypothetical protein
MRRRRRASVVDSGSLLVDSAAVASTLVVFIDGVTYCQRQLAEYDARLATQDRARANAAAKHARRIGRKAGDKESLALAIRAAFAAMSAAHQVANPLVAAGEAWQSFRQAIAVRNRVTHPKSGAHCAVSEVDVKLLRQVHHWYYDVSSALTKRLTPGGAVPPKQMDAGADGRGARRTMTGRLEPAQGRREKSSMMSFDQCPTGTRVAWKPSNKLGESYVGKVVAHNRSGEDIYRLPGYEARRAGKPKAVVSFHRVLVEADHDRRWHAQDLEELFRAEG